MRTTLRLAYREQGAYWHVYVATPDTMVNARLIGLIPLVAVNDPRIRRRFTDLMQETFEALIGRSNGNVEITAWGSEHAAYHGHS